MLRMSEQKQKVAVAVEAENITTISISPKSNVQDQTTTVANNSSVDVISWEDFEAEDELANGQPSSITDPSLQSLVGKKTNRRAEELTPATTSNSRKGLTSPQESNPTKLLFARNQEGKLERDAPAMKEPSKTRARREVEMKEIRGKSKPTPSDRPSISLSSLPRFGNASSTDHRPRSRQQRGGGGGVQSSRMNASSPGKDKYRPPTSTPRQKSSRIPIPLKNLNPSKSSQKTIPNSSKKGGSSRPTTPNTSSRPRTPNRSMSPRANFSNTSTSKNSKPPPSASKSRSRTPSPSSRTRSPSPDVKRRGKPTSKSPSKEGLRNNKGSNQPASRTARATRPRPQMSGFSNGSSRRGGKNGLGKTSPPRDIKLEKSNRSKIPNSFCRQRGQGHDYFHFGHDDCENETEMIDEGAVTDFLNSNPVFLNTFVDECVNQTTIKNWIHIKSPPTNSEMKDKKSKAENERALEKTRNSMKPRASTREAVTDGTTYATTDETTAEDTTDAETSPGGKSTANRGKFKVPPYRSACVCNVAMPIYTLPPPCAPESSKRKSPQTEQAHTQRRARSAKRQEKESAEDADDESTTEASATKTSVSDTPGASTSQKTTTGETTASKSTPKRNKTKKGKGGGGPGVLSTQPIMTETEIESFMALYGVDLRQCQSYTSSYAGSGDLEGTKMMTKREMTNFQKCFHIDIRSCLVESSFQK